jgi:hypothetical protein
MCGRTVCFSTFFLISSSRFRFFLASSSASGVDSASSGALAARRFFPDTSSAIRCYRSAGVSVQSELSTFFAGAAERANWRGLSFVVSSAKVGMWDVGCGKSCVMLRRGYAQPRRSEEVWGTSIHSSRCGTFGFAASCRRWS